MRNFILSLVHRTFQRRNRSGWRLRRDRKHGTKPVNSQPERNVMDKIRAGLLPDESLHTGAFAHFFFSTMNTNWAFVLKMPQ